MSIPNAGGSVVAGLFLQKRHYCIFRLLFALSCANLQKWHYRDLRMIKLKNIAQVSSGMTFRVRIDVATGGGVRVIQMKDLGNDNRVHLSKAIQIDHPKPKDYQLARRGDLIFCSRGQKNTAALLQEEVKNTIVAAPLLRVRPNLERVVPEFLCWWINQSASQAYFASRSEGTSLKMLSKPSLENLNVILPPVQQQKQIADFFRLAMREQELLSNIQNRKAAYTHGILMQIASNQKYDLCQGIKQ